MTDNLESPHPESRDDASPKPTESPAREAIDTVRDDIELRGLLYRAATSILFSIVGIVVCYNHKYPVAISVSIGLLVVLVGVILAVIVTVQALRMRAAVRYPRVSLAAILLAVGVPLIVWGIVALAQN